jgi:hypothetical protein
MEATKNKVYGASDDLIEFEGDVYGEVGCYGTDDEEHGVLVMFSDGTILEVKYGKLDLGIWGITLLNMGTCFDHIAQCTDENAEIYSDIAYFRDGLKWAYASKEWERVK